MQRAYASEGICDANDEPIALPQPFFSEISI